MKQEKVYRSHEEYEEYEEWFFHMYEDFDLITEEEEGEGENDEMA